MRQASLAPELRDAPGTHTRGGGEKRSADQARALISSVQQGWRTGRAATDEPEDGPGDGFGDGFGGGFAGNPRPDEGEIQR